MTCKDCIHDDLCVDKFRKQYPTYTNKNITVDECEHFKNKADFVEVVRCKDCKFGDVNVFSKTKDGEKDIACYCNDKNKLTGLNYYCPYGKRGKRE